MRISPESPERVFIKNQTVPGLAMTRAIGDLYGQECGVTYKPEIGRQKYTTDSFIVMASDGIWEFMQNADVANKVIEFGRHNLRTTCNMLVGEAWNRWMMNDGEVVDDITLIIVDL